MKRLLLLFVLAGCCASAWAQKETGFFAGAGAGMNFGFDGFGYEDRPTSHNGAGYAGDFYAGAWLSENVGLRAGYQGFGISERFTDFGNRKYTYVHGDLLLQLHRNVVPYLHGGYVHIVNPSWGAGAGLMFPIHLGKHVSLIPDLKATTYSSKAFATGQHNLAVTLSATVGVAFRFGGKKKAPAPAPAAVVPLVTEVHDTLTVREVVREVVVDTVYVQPPVPEVLTLSAEALFDTDSATLREEAFPQLDKVVDWFAAHPKARARIEGHTDSTASAAYNQTLSERRAMAVYQYLVDRGVPAGRLRFAGYGFTRPVAPNTTPEGRQLNRRVEIVVEE